jgi:hypothetical protein
LRKRDLRAGEHECKKHEETLEHRCAFFVCGLRPLSQNASMCLDYARSFGLNIRPIDVNVKQGL